MPSLSPDHPFPTLFEMRERDRGGEPVLQPVWGLIERVLERRNEEEDEFSRRELCSDGTCIGVINEKGVCNICGKPYAGDPSISV